MSSERSSTFLGPTLSFKSTDLIFFRPSEIKLKEKRSSKFLQTYFWVYCSCAVGGFSALLHYTHPTNQVDKRKLRISVWRQQQQKKGENKILENTGVGCSTWRLQGGRYCLCVREDMLQQLHHFSRLSLVASPFWEKKRKTTEKWKNKRNKEKSVLNLVDIQGRVDCTNFLFEFQTVFWLKFNCDMLGFDTRGFESNSRPTSFYICYVCSNRQLLGNWVQQGTWY